MKSPPHIPALTGLRGLCVLLVLASHGLFLPGLLLEGGWLGVTGFFVLSGFLITRLLIHERSTTQRIDGVRFYQRRAARLLPALGLVCVAVTLSAIWAGFGIWPEVAAALTYTSDFVAAFGGLAGMRLLGVLIPTWSLAVEEQFYLCWPLFLARRGVPRLRTLALLLGALVGLRGAVALAGVDPTAIYFFPLTHADALLIGAGIAIAAQQGRLPLTPTMTDRFRRVLLYSLPLAAGGLVLAPNAQIGQLAVWPLGGYTLAAGAWGLLLLHLLARPHGFTAHVLLWGPLQGLGLISYGVYLWQTPLSTWLALGHLDWPGLSFIVIVGVAALSYVLVERPIRQWVHGRHAHPEALGAEPRALRAAQPEPDLNG